MVRTKSEDALYKQLVRLHKHAAGFKQEVHIQEAGAMWTKRCKSWCLENSLLPTMAAWWKVQVQTVYRTTNENSTSSTSFRINWNIHSGPDSSVLHLTDESRSLKPDSECGGCAIGHCYWQSLQDLWLLWPKMHGECCNVLSNLLQLNCRRQWKFQKEKKVAVLFCIIH